MAKALSGGDIRVATGLAGLMMSTELIVTLHEKGILNEEDCLKVFLGAVEGLKQAAAADFHPAWLAAQNLLRGQAMRFGGPDPRSKPS